MTFNALSLAFLLQAPAPSGGGLMPLAFQFVLIAAIFYFVMWRPQAKKRKEHETALAALKRGDEVVTTARIIGKVVHIREASKDGGANRMDDRVTIETGEARIVVERGGIARIVGTATAAAATGEPA